MEILLKNLTIGDYQWENPAARNFIFYFFSMYLNKVSKATALEQLLHCFMLKLGSLYYDETQSSVWFRFVRQVRVLFTTFCQLSFAYKQIRSTHLLLHLLYNHQ